MLEDHILFIDAEAIIIDKPAGLPVDTPRDGSPSVETARESLCFGFQRPPLAVHRLDRDTSGCLLLARNPRAHKRFAAAFEAGLADKTYLAVLDGVPADTGGRIALALSKYSTRADGWRMVPDAKGKAATTDWRVLGEADGRALVEFRPQTGRTHQLRVHAAEGIGIPIFGDPIYGRREDDGGDESIGEGGVTMLLHAVRLGLPRAPHPAIAAEAPLPPRFAPWASLLAAEV